MKQLNPMVDQNAPDFDPNDENNYMYVPDTQDDKRRFFIFLPAQKAYKMIKEWEERDTEEEPTDEELSHFYGSVMYSKMPKEEPCQAVLPLNNSW